MRIISLKQRSNRRTFLLASALAGVPVVLATNARAIDSYTGEGSPVIGAYVVVATTGDVTATFIHGSGSYSDFLYLDNGGSSFANGGSGVTGNWIFENHLNSAGNTVDLGTFTAGTVLQFQIVADTTGVDWPSGTSGTQDSGSVLNWYTGPAALNSDGFAHAWVDGSYTGPYGGTAVGFEDLAGLGDAGYEDLIYTFSNVKPSTSVPDAASTVSLLGAGLSALALLGRRLKK